MKRLFKKISIILILITLLSYVCGCDNNSAFHLHIFKQKMDGTRHFMECSCGEIKNDVEHGFEWRSDYKQKECTVCGYIKDEDTSVTVDKDEDGSIKLSDELLAGLKKYFSNINQIKKKSNLNLFHSEISDSRWKPNEEQNQEILV